MPPRPPSRSDADPVRIERPRLSALASDALSATLTVVVAPAGYGKSMMLDDWTRCVRAVIVSAANVATAGDMKREILRALGSVNALPDELPDLVDGGDDETFFSLLSAGEFPADPMIVAVDDFQDAPADVADLLDELIRSGPTGLGIVVASRTAVPLAVPPEVTIDLEALAFTIEEAIELGRRYGIDDAGVVRRSYETTDGWPAALGMVLDALRRSASIEAKPGRPAIQTLGGFGVRVGRRVIGATEWQSKKARDLLKILIARRGRPVARDELMDLLWPGEDPEKLPHRLSVALNTLRAVLDPGKAFEPGRFIGGDAESLWIERDIVEIDVERFLQFADSARRTGSRAEMRVAEALYTGDFLEDDPYAEWAVPLREEARVVFTVLEQHLAVEAEGRGWHDAAVRHWLRVLERDAFDEAAHLGLVRALRAAGRHGEAQRRYQAYVAAMGDLGVEPAPFPEQPA